MDNGKAVHIDGNELTRDEAHEIIISLTGTWGPDFQKQALCDMALGIHAGARAKANETEKERGCL